MLRILSILILETMDRFPDIEMSVVLRELAWLAAKADHDAGTSA